MTRSTRGKGRPVRRKQEKQLQPPAAADCHQQPSHPPSAAYQTLAHASQREPLHPSKNNGAIDNRLNVDSRSWTYHHQPARLVQPPLPPPQRSQKSVVSDLRSTVPEYKPFNSCFAVRDGSECKEELNDTEAVDEASLRKVTAAMEDLLQLRDATMAAFGEPVDHRLCLSAAIEHLRHDASVPLRAIALVPSKYAQLLRGTSEEEKLRKPRSRSIFASPGSTPDDDNLPVPHSPTSVISQFHNACKQSSCSSSTCSSSPCSSDCDNDDCWDSLSTASTDSGLSSEDSDLPHASHTAPLPHMNSRYNVRLGSSDPLPKLPEQLFANC